MGNEHDRIERRLLTSVDIVSYGQMDAPGRTAAEKNLAVLLDSGAARANLDRSRWRRQTEGDGELAILPPEESEPRLVDDFVRELSQALTSLNAQLLPPDRIRLRLAIHHGVADPASFQGYGVIAVTRLVNCAPLRAIITGSVASLAVIVSRQIFNDTVVQGYTSLRPSDFRRVEVREKEYVAGAWVRAPGVDVHSIRLPGQDPEATTYRADGPSGGTDGNGERADRTQPPPRVSVAFHEKVDAPHSIFGIGYKS
jgi:hypothetical protein